MFDGLSERLERTMKNLRGQGRLTEKNVSDSIREVRKALLEADVALSVVKQFTAAVQRKALGRTVIASLTPGQAFIKVVKDELVTVMGGEGHAGLELGASPAVVLMAGLQGVGKTTTVAKLAKYLVEREKRKVMVVSCDVYRPAAIAQLQTLAEQIGVDCFPSDASQSPRDIAKAALREAKTRFVDVLLVDTAGRLAVDADMMAEIQTLHQTLSPSETLFVVDSMIGQDAATTAKAFGEALPLSGVVLTKVDGDARGGAALSVRMITDRPIKFIGVGEKTDALEPFHPERMASRILGMGDVLSLVEDVQRGVDEKEAQKLAKKLQKGQGFNLEDLRAQMQQMQSIGGISALADKMPGMGQINANAAAQGEKDIRRTMAIIDSMTRQERRNPDLIRGSRKRRIAAGSGTQVPEVNRVLKQHSQMAKMMKKMGKGGMGKMLRGLQGKMPGGMPGGGMGGLGGPGGGIGPFQ